LPTSRRAFFDYYPRWILFTIALFVYYFHLKSLDDYDENITITKEAFDDDILLKSGQLMTVYFYVFGVINCTLAFYVYRSGYSKEALYK